MYRDWDQSTNHDTMSVASTIQNKAYFKKNKLSGIYQEFDPLTGELKQQGEFLNGKEVGLWKIYDQDGDEQHFRYEQVRVGAICRDGSFSSATGRGACSWHGGVAEWLLENKPTKVGGTGKYQPFQRRVERAKNKIRDQLKINVNRSDNQIFLEVMERLLKISKKNQQNEKKKQEQIQEIKNKKDAVINKLEKELGQLKMQNKELKTQMVKKEKLLENSTTHKKQKKQQQSMSKRDNQKTQKKKKQKRDKNEKIKKKIQQFQQQLNILSSNIRENESQQEQYSYHQSQSNVNQSHYVKKQQSFSRKSQKNKKTSINNSSFDNQILKNLSFEDPKYQRKSLQLKKLQEKKHQKSEINAKNILRASKEETSKRNAKYNFKEQELKNDSKSNQSDQDSLLQLEQESDEQSIKIKQGQIFKSIAFTGNNEELDQKVLNQMITNIFACFLNFTIFVTINQ